MRVASDMQVTLHYKMSDEQGVLLDSSQQEGPLVYRHDAGELLPALESALEGHVAGDIFTVTLSPEQAYGASHEELVQEMPRHAFGTQAPAPGSRFKAKGRDGAEQDIVVKEVHQNKVVVDANHPLAGKTLVFEVAIVSVEETGPASG